MALDYLVLNQPHDTDPQDAFSNARFLKPGLANVAFHAAVDDDGRLVFIGDGKQVKSYEWGTAQELYRHPLPVHTLNSGSAEGPITILLNGAVARAGKWSSSVWNIGELPTHHQEDIISDEIEIDGHTWRDDPENIELSARSNPTLWVMGALATSAYFQRLGRGDCGFPTAVSDACCQSIL